MRAWRGLRSARNHTAEIESERKLDLVVVEVIAIGEIRPAAPLELTAIHDVFCWIVQQIDEPILSAMEFVHFLQNRVVNDKVRITGRRAPSIVPIMIVERSQTPK